MLTTRERIITAEDLAQGTDKALLNAQTEPLVVTENGRPTAYLISVELFDALVAQLGAMDDAELRDLIDAGEQQFAKGAYKTLVKAAALTEKSWQEHENT